MPDYIRELRKLVGNRPIILCGAAVIFVDDKDRVLLHHRTDNNMWGIPGGAMELGERLEETARREAYEEVGLTCHTLKLFDVYSGPELYYRYPDGNEVYNVSAVYICRDFSGEVKVDQAEGKAANFFSIIDIPSEISPPVRVVIDDFCRRYQRSD